ncbi:hypothetical protein [Erythrobacter sp. THAF29]|uniref:hypothetical protein n=1 Tax=Erythrobacter sp. THAF29 TaxID=2587851 RepID=UPI0012692ACF|nr:hypothetical protein [Erythrobacter sp. THAF29]QFT76011.1 hypothetical protein FIU90_00510 [Erythrobacter sp. THAF29]
MKKKPTYQRAFQLSEGRIKRTDLPKLIERIGNEYVRRKTAKVSFEDGTDTKNESAKNFLRREVYALGIALLHHGPRNWSPRALVESIRKTRTTRPEALSNVFHALLMSIFETDESINRNERSLIAKELEYAHRHEVPPEFLCGFLYQSTDRKKIGERLRSDFTEPAFRD